jgi:large subunit ribosomal protein L28
MGQDGNLLVRSRQMYRSRWRVIVAAVCEICGKHPGFGMSLSRSHRRTKRRWNPNIQRVRALVGGSTRRVNVCTSCIRAGKVQKPARRQVPAAD